MGGLVIDGKSLRGAARPACGLRALHQVSAYAAEYGLTLGPLACQEKSNEITAIGELLPTLALEGAVVNIDAMGCQSAIAEQIVGGGGDYVLAVKDNQPHLAHALRDFFGTLDAPGDPVRQTNGMGRLCWRCARERTLGARPARLAADSRAAAALARVQPAKNRASASSGNCPRRPMATTPAPAGPGAALALRSQPWRPAYWTSVHCSSGAAPPVRSRPLSRSTPGGMSRSQARRVATGITACGRALQV
ncbi:ISAs1 family transposase [Verminephrobacter eiseniae]|nr:ISAs1 family transposase [Verminephrobacter eiseniae]